MQITRKDFFIGSIAATAALGVKAASAPTPVGKIQGFDEPLTETKVSGPWQSFSNKKVRVGIAGYGVCSFGAMFFFQDHPNVEVVAATDLDPERCEKLAQAVRAKRTYSSAEEMIDKEGKNMVAEFIATDAPSHIDLVLRVLDRGYHGGSHPYLTDDFLRAILVPGHKVRVDAATALNTTVTGVYAHLSAMKGGETLKIPKFAL